jgi:uncharacterized protein (DUF2252 family)
MSLTDRQALGKAARQRVSRQELRRWDPGSRTEDALEVIQQQNSLRLAELLPIRHTRMAVSPWTFFRGAAAVMAADLATGPHTGLEVQLCGDAHALNFGLWATPERNLSFDLRDFDETLRGPFEWDVKRLAASLVVIARENALPSATGGAAVTAAISGYRRRMRRYATAGELDIWYDRKDVDDLVNFFVSEERGQLTAHIQRQASRRTSRGAFRKLTEVVDGQSRIREEPPFRVRLATDQFELATDVLATYRRSLPEHVQHLLDRYAVVDVVRQVVGVGSVGMRVYLMLLQGRNGHDPLFLQVKQAGPSVYERHLSPRAGNHGARVVTGKRMLQSAADIFAGWTSARGLDFYVRQFRDMKVIPDSARIAPRLVEFAAACGEVLGRAHARTGDAAAISAYIGRNASFADAMAGFAYAYADQNAQDHRTLCAAITAGTLVMA